MAKTQRLSINELMETSGVKFGTSGARGLVSAMTDRVCFAYTLAFMQHMAEHYDCKPKQSVIIAGDLRSSTPRILTAVARAISSQGYQPVYAGTVPSPAVTYYGLQQRSPSIMVTGSHIPEDRNGIKFNSPLGEILKHDESAIREQVVELPSAWFNEDGSFNSAAKAELPAVLDTPYQHYVERYTSFFDPELLQGMRIGLYQHSSVGRDIFYDILSALGAEVVKLAPADVFVSVDTEAIRPEDIALAAKWAKEQQFDSIISADGDADRPLVSDERGRWLRGDVAGILCARYFGASTVVTPVSSNTAVEKCGAFKEVVRTQIGSPFVIEGMQQSNHDGVVVGYEANGGFLIETRIEQAGRTLAPLPTRDAIIVPLAILATAKQRTCTVSEVVAELPPRFTASDRVKNFPTEISQARLAQLTGGTEADNKAAINQAFAAHFGEVEHINTTDGLRMTFLSGDIIHLRPSGNAPEFRCYAEADTTEHAEELKNKGLAIIESWKPAG